MFKKLYYYNNKKEVTGCLPLVSVTVALWRPHTPNKQAKKKDTSLCEVAGSK